MFSRWVNTDGAVVEILAKRRRTPLRRALLVGVSGLEESGKGHLTSRLESDLQLLGWNAVTINADGWLNLASHRPGRSSSGLQFYEHGLCLDEMFSRLVVPLKANRSVQPLADSGEEAADQFRPQLRGYTDVDIAVVEGVHLFKRAYRDLFDLRFWVDCSFETALERAVERGRKGLSKKATARIYEEVYFPAQRIHFERDDPRGKADFIIENDPRLSGRSARPMREYQAI